MTDNNQFISEEEVEMALDFLRDEAGAIGAARERMVLSERMVKHIRALVMKRYSQLPVAAQAREAEGDSKYYDAIVEEARAAGEFEKMKSLREAAALKIEVWRSMGANYRAMKL